MKNISVNLVLIVLGVFLFIGLVFNSFSGRYQLHSANSEIVIDSWNGNVYNTKSKMFVKKNDGYSEYQFE